MRDTKNNVLLDALPSVIEDDMSDLPKPQDLEIMAVKAGITMAEACRRAKLTPAVFHRWKAGKSSPTLENIGAIIAALQAALPAEVA